MFKRPTGDMKVKKSIDTYVEQQENIPPLQENNGQQDENEGQSTGNQRQPVENNGKQEEESLQQPLQEVQLKNIPPQSVSRSTRPPKS